MDLIRSYWKHILRNETKQKSLFRNFATIAKALRK